MIRIENFSYRFSGSEHYALRDINLDVATGEFVVLTGPSGCGKSTLALALGGFLFNLFGMNAEVTGFNLMSIVVAFVGSVVILGLVRAARRA